ncbi:alpha-L-arabinofuranosidase [Foetidibacter luteolus]|uniref:alpha-L-arabinofuranosidase n=1 Tax=Foetidibacter luteolus TaxID=2608880 RepID=UPI00129BD429|nr:alpha-L-arabinofuranosidase [Foetidibacter luteolus]
MYIIPRLVTLLLLPLALACSKKTTGGAGGDGNGTDTTGNTVVTPADPATENSIGFFLNEWTAKSFTPPSYTETGVPSNPITTVTLDASTVVTKISPALFGNNSNPYMTQMVTETTLLKHITNLHPGIIRFPGGNISSVYFWNRNPGNPPPDAPEKLLNADGAAGDAGYWYGGNTAGWTLSVDNYYSMLQQTGNQGIITINYGYARYGTGADPVAAAAHLAADWVRYDNARTKYWEIGNESNGTWQAGYRIDPSQNKDAQPAIITGELYGKHYKVFADSMRKAATEIGKTIYIGAQLLEKPTESWQTATDKSWNSGVLAQAGNAADYYILHSYYTPFNANSTPSEILASAPKVTAEMMQHVKSSATAAGVSMKPVALTEWNIFAIGSQQMVSQIAGIHAVMVMGELLGNKFGMASRWDLANAWENGNDHGLFSQGEPASGEAKWAPRPAFYYQYFFQKYLGDRFINSSVSGANSGIKTYASTFSSGQVAVTLVNTLSAAQEVKLAFKNFNAGGRYYWYEITGGPGNFSRKVMVNGQGPAGEIGGPGNYTDIKPYAASVQGGVRVKLPPMGVVCLVVDKK